MAQHEFYDLARVRDIGIAAHIDAGKTTLTERILFYTGASHKIGEVHDGEAHMDWMDEERDHGITITSAVTKCPWKDHLVQIVDTPGHVDFTIEVERAMRVLDAAVIVLDGVRGVEPQTETVWRQASRFAIPTLFFVNKMDRAGADFERVLGTLRDRLEAEPAVVAVPVGEALLHVIEQELLFFDGERGEQVRREPVPAEYRELLREHRENLLLALGEHDDEIAEAVLEDLPVEPRRLWEVLHRCTLERRLFPTLGGSALRNRGVQPLLDAIVHLAPSPLERPPVMGRNLEGETEVLTMDPEGPLAALAFKVQLWGGRRHVFARVYRGVLRPGDRVLVVGRDLQERVARVFDVDAHRKKRLDGAFAGQIVLLAGLRRASTGDSLCDPEHPLLLERIDTRDPVVGLAVEPQSSREEEKMLAVLEKILEEDPTLAFHRDEDTGEFILRGMGELHLQVVFERIQREFGLELRAGRPHVVSRETIGARGRAVGSVDRVLEIEKRRVDLKARCVATVEPLARDAGLEQRVEPQVLPEGANLSAAQREAVELGVADALVGGPIGGAPLQDVAVSLEQVEVFGEASSPQALRIAAAQAVRNALQEAGGLRLGPIMKVEVVVPEESLGTVLGDLQARQAAILDTHTEHALSSIQAECSLERLLGYATDLRSLTQGRGQFTSEFNRFDVMA